MGNLEEADEEFRTIEKLRPGVVQRADARYLQVRSLSHRKRFADAIGLAVESLCALGIAVPAADERAADLDRQFEHLYRWLDHSDSADDLARPEISDPALVAATRLIDAVLPGAYFTGDLATYGWLSLEGVRIWLEHGPGRTLIGPASTAAFAAAALRGDHAAGYRALRRILAVGEARGYEPDTSQARHRFDLLAWMFESIEDAAHEALRAREGLLAGGDPTAAYTYYPTAYYLLDCAPTLDEYIEVMDAALAFVRRIGSEHIRQMLVSYRWLAGVLRGEGSFVAGEAVHADEYADNPVALFFAHVNSAVGATVLGDRAALARHTAAATPLLSAALRSLCESGSVTALEYPAARPVTLYLATATDGRLGVSQHAGIPAGDTLAAARVKELNCTTEKLGINPPIMFGLYDQLKMGEGLQPFMGQLSEMRARVTKLFEELQPDAVITWGPSGWPGTCGAGRGRAAPP